jgi:hypothetical protein
MTTEGYDCSARMPALCDAARTVLMRIDVDDERPPIAGSTLLLLSVAGTVGKLHFRAVEHASESSAVRTRTMTVS